MLNGYGVCSNWMWVVEMTRLCPRDIMARYIAWAMNRTGDADMWLESSSYSSTA